MMKSIIGPRGLVLVIALLMAALLACRGDEVATPAPAVPSTPPVEAPRALTADEREIIGQFSEQLDIIQEERDDFYQDFDSWRTGLTECHPSSARETFQALAATMTGVTQRTTNLTRSASTRELADLLIPAAEAEEAAFRNLRDRWNAGNISLFEEVELRSNEAVRAQKSVEDRSLELQEEFEEGPTQDEVEEMEEFSEIFDFLADAWEDYHDSYIDLLKAEAKLKIGGRLAQYELLIQQLEAVVSLTIDLSVPTGNEDIEEIVETLQELAEDELAALMRVADSLAEEAALPTEATEGWRNDISGPRDARAHACAERSAIRRRGYWRPGD